MRSDTARARFGVDGSGIRVGVLSDSFNCTREPFFPDQRFTTAEEDIANADLAQDIRLLEEYRASDCADEGRAMMQIVHDVAPGASLSFHTAYGTQEDFAEGILHLAADGAQILVDDIIYLDEPMFENGVVADAVNAVKKQGKPYFSSAGNEGRRSYQSAFRLTSEQGFDGYRHDFDPGPGIDTLQHIAVAPEGQSIYVVGWDEPSLSANGMKGSRSDIDVIFFNMDGTPVINCDYAPYDAPYCQVIGASFNQDADAVEYAVIANFTDSPLEVQVGIELFAGPAPSLIKGVWFGDEVLVNEYDTRSGTIYGHANAEGAEAVGAAWWFDTAAYGAANHPRCGNACVTYYSSAGGTPILFDDAGERKRVPFLGFKPGVTGPDGGNTTFFYSNETITAPGEPDDFPNFYGTSASAPHVAAVAALMLDQRARDISAHKHFVGPRTLTPDLIYAALRLSAEDIKRRSLAKADPAATEPLNHAQGYDPDSGFGLVNAAKALKLTKGF
jgi:subtilisin family serine protease